ncbi:hypothetical protein EW146_g1009 [Bondarzewia mesenterica]|uniref:C2H2-type domain-containing protein n=1 Tax=Bondarzewia mesenterica TaxID=1095465 RepID=A0A4S4M593_9AGAM|nr:hypothetical protein EW146_g1009 [Bondarzewia mesenterica]
MPVFIGGLSSPSRCIKHVQQSDETAQLALGDIVRSWGHVFEWDDSCVTKEVAEGWRKEGDAVCDEALRVILPSPSSSTGVDLFSALELHAGKTSHDAAHAFLGELSRPPPDDLRVSDNEFRIAREFFLDHAMQIVQALLYYSLAGGFASPRIVRTLHAVSYLVPHDQHKVSGSGTNSNASLGLPSSRPDDMVFSRLMETFQFVLDVMGCTLSRESLTKNVTHILPGGEGWKSSIRVRMLHGVARRRALARMGQQYLDFVPINQEDMSATLAAFSTIPLWCLSRFHLPPSSEQARAYLALWRHVGYYMGVSPAILRRYFATSFTADKFIASTAIHLFSPDLTENFAPTLTPPTLPILRAMSNRPLLRTTFAYNCALARHLLGSDLSSHLGIPMTSFCTLIMMHVSLFIQCIPVLFARYYPRRGWVDKRRGVVNEGLVRVVRWNIGMRRTAYRPRSGYSGEEVEDDGGKLGEGVIEAESVVPDPDGAILKFGRETSREARKGDWWLNYSGKRPDLLGSTPEKEVLLPDGLKGGWTYMHTSPASFPSFAMSLYLERDRFRLKSPSPASSVESAMSVEDDEQSRKSSDIRHADGARRQPVPSLPSIKAFMEGVENITLNAHRGATGPPLSQHGSHVNQAQAEAREDALQRALRAAASRKLRPSMMANSYQPLGYTPYLPSYSTDCPADDAGRVGCSDRKCIENHTYHTSASRMTFSDVAKPTVTGNRPPTVPTFMMNVPLSPYSHPGHGPVRFGCTPPDNKMYEQRNEDKRSQSRSVTMTEAIRKLTISESPQPEKATLSKRKLPDEFEDQEMDDHHHDGEEDEDEDDIDQIEDDIKEVSKPAVAFRQSNRATVETVTLKDSTIVNAEESGNSNKASPKPKKEFFNEAGVKLEVIELPIDYDTTEWLRHVQKVEGKKGEVKKKGEGKAKDDKKERKNNGPWRCTWLTLKNGQPTPCSYASKKHLVKRHIEATHLRIKRFQCTWCDKTFTQRSNVSGCHLNTHTGESPHGCNYCGECFKDPSKRHKHMRKHHAYRPGSKRVKLNHTCQGAAVHESIAPWPVASSPASSPSPSTSSSQA